MSVMFVASHANYTYWQLVNDAEIPRTMNQEIGMLRINIQSSNSGTSLHCVGSLLLGVETETLRAMAQSRPEKNIRIDLSGVEKIDASGLGLLVELQCWARKHRRHLTFIELSEAVWNLVILTKLYSALEISYAGLEVTRPDNGRFARDEMIA